MSYTLPLALTPKKTLLIGAGAVAKQKHQILTQAHWETQILAQTIQDSYFEDFLVQIKKIEAQSIEDFKDYLSDFEVIVDASGDSELGKILWEQRKTLGYLLNVVDKPCFCDFYFGALVRYEEVSILVSSNGASPILAQSIRDKIAAFLPKTFSSLAQKLYQIRTKQKINTQVKQKIKQECQKSLGKVFIIGCGPNRLESLTLKALETLEWLDVALLDNLIGKEIWDFLENLGVECISVGKQKGKSSFKQEEINALMLKLAQEGKCVGRLKGGDPTIFGRVWEEASFLQKNGIEVETLSGLSSSLSGALTSGITPTLRGISSGVLIVSAHLRENIFHAEWLKWLKDSPYTLIVMMAYSFSEKILKEAKKLEIDLNLPAAFISKVDCADQKNVIGTLGNLERMAQICDKPAILILGNAVKESLCMPFRGQRIII